VCHSQGMTAFLDKQGRFILLLVALLGLCYVVAFAITRKPDVVPEDSVNQYLNALQRGDSQAAYALLSEEDRQYFDRERFKDFLRRQPHLQLLYGGSGLGKNSVVRDLMRYELVEPKQDTQHPSEVLMKVTLPDVAKVLGQELLQFYLFGEENQALTTEQSLEMSKRVEAKLRWLNSAPTLSSYQKFALIERKGQWQLSVPEWRVEAMVYEAKQKLVEQETEDAALLLEQASTFVLKVDDITRTTFVREAIAGKHMLLYLPQVAISALRLERQTGLCRRPVTLELSNRGERSVRSVDVVVQFMDDKNKKVVADQIISLNRGVLGKQTGSFLPASETVTTTICLTPPYAWSGIANSHLAWLTFAEDTD
jgi:hypothetical protein